MLDPEGVLRMGDNPCRCARCGKAFFDHEYDAHKCKIRINGKIVKILVDYWIQGKHPDTGEDLISAKALDGTTYWFVKRSSSPMDKVPFNPSAATLHQDDQPPTGQSPPGDSVASFVMESLVGEYAVHLTTAGSETKVPPSGWGYVKLLNSTTLTR